jgi:hypothetical protein
VKIKNNNDDKHRIEDEFVHAARRAFKRVARRLRIEHRRLGLPLISARNGRVHLIHPAAPRTTTAR